MDNSAVTARDKTGTVRDKKGTAKDKTVTGPLSGQAPNNTGVFMIM